MKTESSAEKLSIAALETALSPFHVLSLLHDDAASLGPSVSNCNQYTVAFNPGDFGSQGVFFGCHDLRFGGRETLLVSSG